MMQANALSSLEQKSHPPSLSPGYKSTIQRAPKHQLVPLPQTLSEYTGPVYGTSCIRELDNDLTRNATRNGEAIGERIIIQGQVKDDTGRPVPSALVELWQANACGRYIHKLDQHDAPLDPNFSGAGRALTDDQGSFTFTTIRPAAYPWRNHHNAWRPSHIHFSVFGANLTSRLVTQMYFPGDPLLELDPIYNSIPGRNARQRLIANYDHELTKPLFALGYRFDIVLCGSRMTPFENLKQ